MNPGQHLPISFQKSFEAELVSTGAAFTCAFVFFFFKASQLEHLLRNVERKGNEGGFCNFCVCPYCRSPSQIKNKNKTQTQNKEEVIQQCNVTKQIAFQQFGK